MVTSLYNTSLNSILSTRNGYYKVDGVRPDLPENIVELVHTEDPIPDYNPSTQKLLSAWIVDLNAKEYRLSYWVENKTALEIALDGWHHLNYAKRIIAPVQLVMDDIGVKFHAWFTVHGYPIERVGEQLYCYCNTIAPEHQAVVDSLQEVITIEDRPT